MQGRDAAGWDAQAARYRAAWERDQAGQGGSWDEIAPAYRLAWDLAHTPGLEYGRSWADVAPEFERQWARHGSGLGWERAGAVMRHVWEDVTNNGRVILEGDQRAPQPERHQVK